MTHSPEVLAEIERRTAELQTEMVELCAGQNVAIVAGAIMNILGECFVALASRPDLFEGLADNVREIPDKARAIAQATKAH